ncbi:hypothetical protein [Gandjariella thermophila]|uniref:Uncharacterized protein n=1 Tax=Gandjariella thermophila TaxID=1931992 RepID=A0A4D4J6P3_9PSEU|nr:hypothetical protein [Gandjariella thermophila]GDY32271.1 hypothetical protein GTS_39040 [Gandjariella thermophila]
MVVGRPDQPGEHVRLERSSGRDRATVDPFGLETCYEVPARDRFGRPHKLRLWPERGTIALDCAPADGPLYVDVAHAGELRSFLSASAYRAALLAGESNLREADGAADDCA